MGDKRQKQSEFWKTLIQKYETRNAQLAEKQCDLRHRLEAMECSMPALLCFNMMQMSHNNPDNDLKNFITQLQQPAEKPSGVLNINCTCDPCPIQQKESNNRQKYGNQSPCDCDPCPVKDCACGGSVTDTAHGAPIRENTSCQCDMNKMSAGDKQTPTNRPLNVRGDVHMQSCNCSPCPLSNQGKPATPTSNNMCGCNATANTKPSAGIETKCFCEPTCDCKSCPMLNKNSNQNGCGCNSPPTTNKIKPHSQSIQNCDSCGCNSSPTINNRVQHSQSTQNDDRCGCNSSPTTNNRAQYSQSTQNDDSCGCYSRPTTNMNNEHGCKCNPCPMTNNKQQPSGHDDSCACSPCPMTNDANTSPMECSCELECDCESCPMLNNSSSASSTSQDCACDSGQKSKYNTPKSPNMDLCKCNNCPAIETNTDRPMTSCDCNPGPSSSSPKTSQIASDRGKMKPNKPDELECVCDDGAERKKKMTCLENSLSGLQIAIAELQVQCKEKDKILESITEEVKLRANSNVFNDMLKNLAKSVEVDVIQEEDSSSESEICPCDYDDDPSPLSITQVQPVTSESVLLKWTPTTNEDATGYEICLNGVLQTQIHRPQRNSALVTSSDLKKNTNISIYVVTPHGRCEPPAASDLKF